MFKFFIFVVALFSMVSVKATAHSPIDSLLNRAELYLRQTSVREDVQKLMSSLKPDKQWPDIDYAHQGPSGWKVAAHLQRVRGMALTWTDPSSALYRSAALKTAVDDALDHWLEKRYQNPNWWHNAIGIPRVMKEIILLLRRDMTSNQFKQAMEVLGQHRVQGTGANLVWSADLGLHYGALSGDSSMIRKCSDLISNEIKLSKREGIQPDYSYHQHGPRLQTYHYGSAFLRENIKLAWELRGTPWAFPAEKTDIIADFVLNGWQWMARGVYTVPGTIDRAASREGALKGADLRDIIPYLIELKPERSSILTALKERQEGTGWQLNGYRHYPYSDFSAYHRPDFSFFLKTVSNRTRFTESINGENLKGKFLNSGDGYFVRDGMEYYNLMPVWNWKYLPGITTFPDAQTKQQAFTGGVNAGTSGLTSMQHQAEHDSDHFAVKKSWFSHNNVVVVLLADFQMEGFDSAYTVLDQCRWRTDVSANISRSALREGIHRFKNVTWIHHAGFAYMPLSPSDIELHLTSSTGTWSSVNESGAQERVTEKVFIPVMHHHRVDASAAYFVAPCKDPKQAKRLYKNPGFRIIRNDGTCQSIQFDDGTAMAAFFSSEQIMMKGDAALSADRPCLLVLSNGRLFISEPTHQGGTINLRIGDRSMSVAMPADGTTVEVNWQG